MNASTKRFAEVIGVYAAVAAVLAALVLLGTIRWKRELDAGSSITIALFIFGVLELRRTSTIQRADFVKSYVAQFYSADLYSIFHDLVYTFNDDLFGEIDRRYKQRYPGDARPDSAQLPDFEPFQDLQRGRAVGRRFYHPSLFQHSDEEQRLDRLLGYFDILGYYVAKGLVDLSDVVTSVGYYIAVLKSRAVVQSYLNLCKSKWSTLPYEEQMGTEPPYRYVVDLFTTVKRYNDAQTEARIRKRRK